MMIMIIFMYFYMFIIIVSGLYFSIDHLFVMQSVGDHVGVQIQISNLNLANGI